MATHMQSEATHTRLPALSDWVAEVAKLTQPSKIHWCDGSAAEYGALIAELIQSGGLVELNQASYPGCYLHRSDPQDVARVEHLTYVCARSEADAGPNNNWMAPAEAKRLLNGLFRGSMRERTMYVIPYCMGPLDSPYARLGVEITDSAYVAVNMYLMTRMGERALELIEQRGYVRQGPALDRGARPEAPLYHALSRGALDHELRLGLRRQCIARQEMPCAAYRELSGENRRLARRAYADRRTPEPEGETHYLACAFPSACGKTNLAMLIPPESLEGWKVWTLGDDIAWMHVGAGRAAQSDQPRSGLFRRRPRHEPQARTAMRSR